MLFAHLKRYIGVPMMRLRGPKGAYEQFQLAATAQSLRRLAKLVLQPEPIASQQSYGRFYRNPQTLKHQLLQHYPDKASIAQDASDVRLFPLG